MKNLISTILVGLVFLAIGCGVLFLGNSRKDFIQGQAVISEVDTRSYKKTKDNKLEDYVEYKYKATLEVNGESYTRKLEDNIKGRSLDRIKDGQLIKVSYSVEDPASFVEYVSPIFYNVTGGIFAVLGLVLTFGAGFIHKK